jgi:hypothetical protein
MSVSPQQPPGTKPTDGRDGTPRPWERPLWQQFLIGAVGVLLVVGAILLVVRVWAIPALQARGSDAGIAGEATLAALQTLQALSPHPTATNAPVPAAQPTVAPTSAPRTPVATVAATAAAAAAPTLAQTAETAQRPTAGPAEESTADALASSTGAIAGVVPNVNGTPYPLPTPGPEVAAAVSEAYLQYWSVRADALLALDPTGLDQVAAQDELAALDNNIEADRAQGRALKTDVQHQFKVLTVVDNQAAVVDRFRDSSIYVTPGTTDPLPGQMSPGSPDQAPQIGVLYKLELIDATWKVVQGQMLP